MDEGGCGQRHCCTVVVHLGEQSKHFHEEKDHCLARLFQRQEHQNIVPSTDLQVEMFSNLLDLFYSLVERTTFQDIIASASGSDLTVRQKCRISNMLSMRPQLLGCNMNTDLIDRLAWLL